VDAYAAGSDADFECPKAKLRACVADNTVRQPIALVHIEKMFE